MITLKGILKRRRNLGFVFQSFNLIDDLTVYENVELPLLYQNVPRGQRKARVREVLELVDLRPREKHKPAQLSGGQQQRVAVARAHRIIDMLDGKVLPGTQPKAVASHA